MSCVQIAPLARAREHREVGHAPRESVVLLDRLEQTAVHLLYVRRPGPLGEHLEAEVAHHEVRRGAEHGLERRQRVEVFPREAAAARHDALEQVLFLLAVAHLALRELAALALVGHLAQQRVDLRARHHRARRGRHPLAQARHELPVARHDDVRADLGVLPDGERHARGRLRHRQVLEHVLEGVVIAIEVERPLGVGARDAIEALEEVGGVRHGSSSYLARLGLAGHLAQRNPMP